MEDKIIAKISKLLSLGNGTNYEGEAEASLQKAYTLMQEHNISMTQVEDANREEELGPLEETTLRQFPSKKWEQSLFYIVAQLFDCTAFISTRRINYSQKQKTYTIVGRQGNRVTAELMYKWLRAKITKDSLYQGASVSASISYSWGCVFAIQNKVTSLKSSAPKTDAWGIVPMDEVENFIRLHHPNMRSSKGGCSIRDYGAYMQGHQDGQNISFNRQFGQHAICDR